MCVAPCAWGGASAGLPLWPSLRGGPTNPGLAPRRGTCKGELAWKAPLSQAGIGSPVVDAAGRILVVSGSQVLPFGPDGRPGSAIALDQTPSPSSSPALDEGGRLHLVGDKGLDCYDTQGRRVWRCQVAGVGHGPINLSEHGFAYFGMNDPETRRSVLVAVESNGTLMWRQRTSDAQAQSFVPAITSNHEVVVSINIWQTTRARAKAMWFMVDFNGFHVRRFLEHGSNVSPVALSAQDEIYFSTRSDNGTLYRLTKGGTTRWSRPMPSGSIRAPIFGRDGRVVTVCDRTGTARSYSLLGDLEWTYEVKQAVAHDPVMDRDGNVYLSTGKALLCLDPKGKKAWGPVRFGVTSELAIGRGGALVVLTDGGRSLACFR